MISVYEYIHIPTNKPAYVGQSRHPITRNRTHRSIHGTCPFDKVLRAALQDYQFVILHENLTQEDADYLETYYMIAHKTWHGMGGFNYFLSRYYDVDEYRKVLSRSLKGKKKPEGFGQHVRRSRLGKTLSAETRKKISENHADVSGAKNPFYGKKLTVEQREANAARQRHPNLDAVKILKWFDSGVSLTEIGKTLGCSRMAVTRYFRWLRPNQVLTKQRHGPQNGMFGKRHEASTRDKIRQKALLRYAQKRSELSLPHPDYLSPSI